MAPFTADSIPDVADVREGLLHRLERGRVPILAGLAVVVVGALALLALSAVRREKVDSLAARLHAITDEPEGDRTLFSVMRTGEVVTNRDVAAEQATALEGLRADAAGTEIEAQVLLHLAIRYQITENDDRCLAALADLRASHPESPVLALPSLDNDTRSLVDRIQSVSERRKKAGLVRKVVVPKPGASVTALVETDLGKMRIGFYEDVAPKHVAAFLEQAKKGAFNGTRVYQVRRGAFVEAGGGDRTRDAEPRNDRDDEDALAIPWEDTARYCVKHRRRTVTSVPLLSGDQVDRFAVVLSETREDFDGTHTPFGELLDDESAAVADRLGNALTYADDAAYLNRRERTDYPNSPSKPVLLRRVSIWRDGALDAGHAWDTSRVNTDQPEPAPEPKEEPAPKDGNK
jgi:cyclophilin family peptidyl-prolyl cis-trans isomerase